MLYISRRYGTNKYGVVDTDDGVEELCTYNDLQEAVCENGVEIRGVETTNRYGRGISKKPRISRIHVYQNEETVKAAQVKLNILKGIDIKTDGSEIVSLSLKHQMTEPISVRLSDFGSSCADYIFSDIGGYGYDSLNNVTIVLDDKIVVSSKTFKRCAVLGMIVDLRDVSNIRTVDFVYRDMLSEKFMCHSLLQRRVLDHPDRLSYWRAVCILNHGYRQSETEGHISRVIPQYEEVEEEINRKFIKEFIALSKSRFGITGRKRTSNNIQSYITWLAEPKNREIRVTTDFNILKTCCMDALFRVLTWDTNCVGSSVQRFENYVKYFDVPPEVRAAFVKFCGRANDFLLAYGCEKGWVR